MDGVGDKARSPLLDGIDDPHRRRGVRALLLANIDRALDKLTPKDWNDVIESCRSDLSNPDSVGARRSAREHLLKINDAGVNAALALDRIERLDAGGSTENVATTIKISFDKGG